MRIASLSLLTLALLVTSAVSAQAPTEQGINACAEDVLLVPDMTNPQGVALFDPLTGDLLSGSFVSDPLRLSEPTAALPNFDEDGILVVDADTDAVFEYDCQGNFVGLFAPAGGVDTNIMAFPGGMSYSPDGTQLWVTVRDGPNQGKVVAFDAAGNYVGNFADLGGETRPIDVLVREADVLVSESRFDDVFRYSHGGVFLETLVDSDGQTGIDNPQQIAPSASGAFLVAGFNTPSGIYEYDNAGNQVALYNVVANAEGVYELPNGNLLVARGFAFVEVARDNTVVREIANVGDQFIHRFPPAGGGGCPLTLAATLDSTTPAPGDVITFAVTASNTGPAPSPVALWLDVTGPVSRTIQLGSGTLPAGATVVRNVGLTVPGNAPAGTYALDLRLGVAFPDVCQSVPFTVTVQGSAATRSDGSADFEVVEAFVAEAASAASVAARPVAVAPNPFSRQTSLTFTVPDATYARLAVYDVLGREVAVLVDGPVEAGTHRAALDGRRLAPGTYLWRLVAGDRVEAGQMTLLR